MLKLIRFTPRALFARRIVVCEGYTEVGLLMGLRELWPPDHKGLPIEHRGAAIVDGNGSETCSMALNLASMGFTVAIYRDSDDALRPAQTEGLTAAGIPVFEYGAGMYTEQTIFEAANEADVQRILEYAREQRGEGFINDNLMAKIPGLDATTVRAPFEMWSLLTGLDPIQLRAHLSEVSSGKAFETREEKKSKNWFKEQIRARGLAPIVHNIMASNAGSPLAQTLKRVEAWLYG
jgi:hypothetical protein